MYSDRLPLLIKVGLIMVEVFELWMFNDKRLNINFWLLKPFWGRTVENCSAWAIAALTSFRGCGISRTVDSFLYLGL